MSKKGKELTNPFSSGGGGAHFEAHVQASFVVLMLAGGFAPCMPRWPISKIELQGKSAGYDTDDMIVFVKNEGDMQECKVLVQIKRSIRITKNSPVFHQVVQAAWNDFNNSDMFSRGKDAIALITGPLSATDINDVRTILEWARHSENASEFFRRVDLTHFSSEKKSDKLQAFRRAIEIANNGKRVPDEVLFDFMKHFHLLGYDLDVKSGVTLALLHSLIGKFSPENVQSLWAQLVDAVQSVNKNAGTISPESLPKDLRNAFKKPVYESIPQEFLRGQPPSIEADWSHLPHAPALLIAALVGAWNEENAADRSVVSNLANEDYGSWISKMREVLQLPGSPLSLKNGIWRVTDRKGLWKALSTKLFDDTLDNLKQCTVAVLSERDPKFDLPPEERFAAVIHGKTLKYSPELRRGLAESLALLGAQRADLPYCSQDKSETTAILAVREILKEADWVLWGSLDSLLPILAEAAPDEFLNAVDKGLRRTPCVFDELFSQEGRGVFGHNYLTGLLWGLETLAWDEGYLVRACLVLAELATHDPGGQWSNRPVNSIATILLPWLPQTTADVNKRKVALQTLVKRVPAVAWKVLLGLLPNQHQISMGTYKPSWRIVIPDDGKEGVTRQEYWSQVSFCAELAVSMASNDMEKLKELIRHLDCLPESSLDKVLEHLSSESVHSKTENERLELWEGLTEFTSRHRRYSDAHWALNSETVSRIEAIAAKLAPKNPMNLHRRLFTDRDFDLHEGSENWDEEQQNLRERRRQAIRDILAYGGVDAAIGFVEMVESPGQVGYALADSEEAKTDERILPILLETGNRGLGQFVNGYVQNRYQKDGWAWVDGLDKSRWTVAQIAQFLSYLPFTDETWTRASAWLGKSEREYWRKTNVNPYQAPHDMGVAIDKLIMYERPHAAISCLYRILSDKQRLDKSRSVRALLAALSSTEPPHGVSGYQIVAIIRALQDDPDTDPEDLFRIEWSYLPLLDRHTSASPKLLESRLASDPAFFCEVIRLLYRPKREAQPQKPPSEREKSFSENARKLLHEWQIPPGLQADGTFLGENFTQWLDHVKESCTESGHLEVAFIHVGQVLIHCPPDQQGLWIDRTVAEALDTGDADKLREGFNIGVFNSRGAHWVGPTGKPELELAEQYRRKAEEIENAGYLRFAATVRNPG